MKTRKVKMEVCWRKVVQLHCSFISILWPHVLTTKTSTQSSWVISLQFRFPFSQFASVCFCWELLLPQPYNMGPVIKWTYGPAVCVPLSKIQQFTDGKLFKKHFKILDCLGKNHSHSFPLGVICCNCQKKKWHRGFPPNLKYIYTVLCKSFRNFRCLDSYPIWEASDQSHIYCAAWQQYIYSHLKLFAGVKKPV